MSVNMSSGTMKSKIIIGISIIFSVFIFAIVAVVFWSQSQIADLESKIKDDINAKYDNLAKNDAKKHEIIDKLMKFRLFAIVYDVNNKDPLLLTLKDGKDAEKQKYIEMIKKYNKTIKEEKSKKNNKTSNKAGKKTCDKKTDDKKTDVKKTDEKSDDKTGDDEDVISQIPFLYENDNVQRLSLSQSKIDNFLLVKEKSFLQGFGYKYYDNNLKSATNFYQKFLTYLKKTAQTENSFIMLSFDKKKITIYSVCFDKKISVETCDSDFKKEGDRCIDGCQFIKSFLMYTSLSTTKPLLKGDENIIPKKATLVVNEEPKSSVNACKNDDEINVEPEIKQLSVQNLRDEIHALSLELAQLQKLPQQAQEKDDKNCDTFKIEEKLKAKLDAITDIIGSFRLGNKTSILELVKKIFDNEAEDDDTKPKAEEEEEEEEMVISDEIKKELDEIETLTEKIEKHKQDLEEKIFDQKLRIMSTSEYLCLLLDKIQLKKAKIEDIILFFVKQNQDPLQMSETKLKEIYTIFGSCIDDINNEFIENLNKKQEISKVTFENSTDSLEEDSDILTQLEEYNEYNLRLYSLINHFSKQKDNDENAEPWWTQSRYLTRVAEQHKDFQKYMKKFNQLATLEKCDNDLKSEESETKSEVTDYDMSNLDVRNELFLSNFSNYMECFFEKNTEKHINKYLTFHKELDNEKYNQFKCIDVRMFSYALLQKCREFYNAIEHFVHVKENIQNQTLKDCTNQSNQEDLVQYQYDFTLADLPDIQLLRKITEIFKLYISDVFIVDCDNHSKDNSSIKYSNDDFEKSFNRYCNAKNLFNIALKKHINFVDFLLNNFISSVQKLESDKQREMEQDGEQPQAFCGQNPQK